MPSALWGSLPVLLGLLLWHPTGATGPCWESSRCQDLTSDSGVLVSLGTAIAIWLLWVLTPPGTGTVGWGWR